MAILPLLLIALVFFAFVLKGVFFLCRFDSPEEKGKRGEERVASLLERELPKTYVTLSDLYLPLPDGTTTQIDHVVISPYGIFVIESKNYSGWIFGEEKSVKWTQVLFQERHSFQNPIRQNYQHIYALARMLRIHRSYFHNVVAFTEQCEFKVGMPAGVVYAYELPSYIRTFTKPLLEKSQIQILLKRFDEELPKVKAEAITLHAINLKRRHEGVRAGEATPKCPYCGGPMVLRTPKKGGNPFYGCKAYPKCRGIVKVTS